MDGCRWTEQSTRWRERWSGAGREKREEGGCEEEEMEGVMG